MPRCARDTGHHANLANGIVRNQTDHLHNGRGGKERAHDREPCLVQRRGLRGDVGEIGRDFDDTIDRTSRQRQRLFDAGKGELEIGRIVGNRCDDDPRDIDKISRNPGVGPARLPVLPGIGFRDIDGAFAVARRRNGGRCLLRHRGKGGGRGEDRGDCGCMGVFHDIGRQIVCANVYPACVPLPGAPICDSSRLSGKGDAQGQARLHAGLIAWPPPQAALRNASINRSRFDEVT